MLNIVKFPDDARFDYSAMLDNTRTLPKRIQGTRSQGLNDHQVAASVPENFVVSRKPVDLANVNVAEVSAAEVFNDVEFLPGEV